MPNYSNAVAQTSQATTVSSGNLVISYSNISLIAGVPHKYQLEVERIFTADRDGSSAIVTSFLSDAGVSVEDKRNVFIIPELDSNNSNAVLWTINEINKTITINNTNLALRNYPTPSYGSHPDIKVPTVVDGQVVTLRRKTISNTPLVTWTAGTTLTSNQLNLETTQLLYLLQEVLDRVYRQISISGDIVSQIADNSVTTSKIVDLNVTTGKINDLAVTTAKIADLNVTTGKINNLAVTTGKIADYNITPAKLINTTQAWSLTGTLALTDLATSATGDKVANKNYVLDRVSKYGVITKDSTVTSNVLDTPPTIPTDANDDVSLQSGGIWFNPRDGGLRVRVLDKWVRVTGTPLNITDYISTGGTAQTKTGNLILTNGLNATGTITFNNSITIAGNAGIAPTDNLTGLWISGQNAGYPNGGTIVFRGNNGGAGGTAENGLEFYTGGSEKMRITSSGVVGIGPSANTTPVASERFVIGGSNSAEYMTIKSAAQTFVAGSDSNNTFLGSFSNTPLQLRTNNLERMRINDSGSILIGHTTPIGNQGGPRGLTIYTPTHGSNYMWFTGGNPYLVYLESKEATTTGYLLFINQAGTTVGAIRSDGGNTTSYNTTSDYRLKSNISPITNSLTKISSLKPCSYSWLSDNSLGEGFIAHELQEVIPHAVSGKKDAIKEDGSIDPQQVDLSKIIPVLTAAVQELKTIVEEQAKRISVLEGK